MSQSAKKLEQRVKQLSTQQIKEVIDFVEFLEFKMKKKIRPNSKKPTHSKRFEIPTIKHVKFVGDPLLRREEIYNDWGR